MINRRQLIASAIVASAATSSHLAHAQSEPTQLNIGDARIVGFSPDASTLVGVQDGETLVFIDLDSLEIVAQSAPMPELGMLEDRSVSWNPAGTHVAFSLDAWRLMRDSDIFIAEVSTGVISNLTPEANGEVAAKAMQNPELLLDVYPAWIDDETLVFARHLMISNLTQSDLYTIGIDGGEPEHVIDLTAEGVQYVSAPLFVNANNQFATLTHDDEMVGTPTLIDMAGTVERLDLAAIDHPQLLDTNDTHLLVSNRGRSLEYWLVPFDDPEEVTNLHEALGVDESAPHYILPILGPEPDSVLAVAGEDREIIMKNGDDVRVIGTLPREMSPTQMFWSGSTVILANSNDVWRLNIEG